MERPRRSHLFCLAAALALQPAGLGAQGQPQPGNFAVVIDAAHGGADTGTTFSPQLLEKNLVLSLSVHLRSALAARGMTVTTTRESDIDPAPETRAAEANHAAAGACLVLHATANGSGVHLYTSSLAQAATHAGDLTPWNTAGAPYATQSLELASEIARTMTGAGVPYTLGTLRLPALDSMQCPAVVVEFAPLRASPLHSGYTPVDDAEYQTRLVDGLAAALVAWRDERVHSAGDDQ